MVMHRPHISAPTLTTPQFSPPQGSFLHFPTPHKPPPRPATPREGPHRQLHQVGTPLAPSLTVRHIGSERTPMMRAVNEAAFVASSGYQRHWWLGPANRGGQIRRNTGQSQGVVRATGLEHAIPVLRALSALTRVSPGFPAGIPRPDPDQALRRRWRGRGAVKAMHTLL